jgi:hypothetical protein
VIARWLIVETEQYVAVGHGRIVQRELSILPDCLLVVSDGGVMALRSQITRRRLAAKEGLECCGTGGQRFLRTGGLQCVQLNAQPPDDILNDVRLHRRQIGFVCHVLTASQDSSVRVAELGAQHHSPLRVAPECAREPDFDTKLRRGILPARAIDGGAGHHMQARQLG